MNRATQDPRETFKTPEGGPWKKPSVADLVAARKDGEEVLYASWDGWRRAKIDSVQLIDGGRKIESLVLRTASGGTLEIEPRLIRTSILVRDRGKVGG